MTAVHTSIIEDARFRVLADLASKRFGKPKPAEALTLKLSASSNNIFPDKSAESSELRAEVLRWLLTDRDAVMSVDPLGVRVFNAVIVGQLNLNFCKIPVPLRMAFCTLSEPLSLAWAELPFLYISNSSFSKIIDGTALKSSSVAIVTSRLDDNVVLSSARIEGGVDFSGSNLNGSPSSLDMGEASIAGSIRLTSSDDRPFTTKGTVFLNYAKVIGMLDCQGAKLLVNGTSGSETPDAINANACTIQNVYLTSGFSAGGPIKFVDAVISGDLEISCAERIELLICYRLKVGQRMIYTDVPPNDKTKISLLEASVGVCHDNKESWPKPGNLSINGFEYQELVSHVKATEDDIKNNRFGDSTSLGIDKRLDWIRLQPPDDRKYPQPWIQFSKYLQNLGDLAGARHVVYEFHREQAEGSRWSPLPQLYYSVEEKPIRVSLPIVGLWALGSLVFWRANRIGAMRCTTPPSSAVGPPPPTPPFNPFVYALENVLPVVKLGQDSAWAPDPSVTGGFLPDCWIFRALNRFLVRHPSARWLLKLTYGRLAALRWVLILLGWALALILASAIAEQFKN